jgi:serine/threonine protein kinase
MESLQPGTRIGAYAIDRLLSDKGGFSLVYRAHHPRHGAVAIKECAIAGQADRRGTVIVPRPERRADFDWTRARFRQEARFLLDNGRHPHIVNAIELIEANDTAYLVMELLHESLDQRLQREGAQSAEAVARWLDPVGQALVFCEAQGCHHLDIAPKNVMFDQQGRAKLIDFGFSRLGNASRLRTTRLATTDGYSPVEKYSFSSRDLDSRSDVYSLAATVVRALTNAEPVDARVRQGEGKRPFVSAEGERMIVAAVGPGGLAVLDKAMAVQKSERHATVAAFLAAWHASLPGARPQSNGARPVPNGASREPPGRNARQPAVARPEPAVIAAAPGVAFDRDRRRKFATILGIGAIALVVLIWMMVL